MDIKALAATLLLLAVAAVNLIPGIVALLPDRTVALYGIGVDGGSMTLLMRHRAVLLACVGLGLGAAAFVPSVRPPALAFAAISKLSFLALYLMTPGLTPELQRVAAADLVALALLAIAALLG
ncbi:phosphopantetheine adenylyltransferase [Pyxidicoccus xibeiensis]|uniref:phosphopantetheine adenylyltransferase n=1 Tax=Pyxidicoccus xibeiensis TaxID=2906759 RepID=UPI0020A736B7|nr:phosphopantetheine adenylyltransferase [Pyxidicoccus xibeiensis]MCP3141762.1 phosphopantetheine adenylyltransferase [Pyxidicoccus xibeiensis]